MSDAREREIRERYEKARGTDGWYFDEEHQIHNVYDDHFEELLDAFSRLEEVEEENEAEQRRRAQRLAALMERIRELEEENESLREQLESAAGYLERGRFKRKARELRK